MRRYLIFAVVGMVLLLGALSSTSVSVAFPTIISSFNTSLIVAGWVMGSYQLTYIATTALGGKASDALGRKRTLMLSLGVFILGSLLCSVAPNVELLILFRLMQGIGGGALMPSATGIVADEFPLARQRVIGLLVSIWPIGMIIGPNVGGWMVTALGWRSVFWLNIPVAVGILIATALLLKPGRREKVYIDLQGAALFTASLLAFMLAISAMGNGAAQWGIAAILLIACIAFIVLFARRESRSQNPVIDVEMLRARPFLAANVYNFVFGAAAWGILTFVPLYAVSIYGMTTFRSGLILTPMSAGMIVASTVTSFFLLRWGYRWPMLIGTTATVLSLAFLGMQPGNTGILGVQLSSTVVLLIVLGFSGLGQGVLLPAANNACIDLMPQQIGTITGMRAMFRQGGGAVGTVATSLVLHNTSDMARGFYIVFLGLAAMLLVTIPTIFGMPSCAKAPATRDTR